MRGVAWGVAVAIGGVSVCAATGALFAARRLGELPDSRVGNASGGDGRRILRIDAAGSWRTNVVEDPVDEFAIADVVTDVIGSDDADAVAFVVGNSGTVDSGPIAGGYDGVRPGAEISVIVGG